MLYLVRYCLSEIKTNRGVCHILGYSSKNINTAAAIRNTFDQFRYERHVNCRLGYANNAQKPAESFAETGGVWIIATCTYRSAIRHSKRMFTELINVTVLWNVTNLPDFVKLSWHALLNGDPCDAEKRDLLSRTNGEKYRVISCRL